MGVLFVDDTDLYIMDECIKSEYDLWHETQDATTSWGKLLLATGGALKPEKCFYYLVDYEWQDDGTWEYSSLVETTPPITVPLSDGTAAEIKHLPVDKYTKENARHMDKSCGHMHETAGGYYSSDQDVE